MVQLEGMAQLPPTLESRGDGKTRRGSLSDPFPAFRFFTTSSVCLKEKVVDVEEMKERLVMVSGLSAG